jgi:hypothetical protein
MWLEHNILQNKTPWTESASELYRPKDRSLSAKLLPTFADRECRVLSPTDPHGRISRFSRPEQLLSLPSSSSIALNCTCTLNRPCAQGISRPWTHELVIPYVYLSIGHFLVCPWFHSIPLLSQTSLPPTPHPL